ncbi:hypothetical protein RQM59_00550 [Flavobacteriaceae bacterium S356]|uniref:Uncharacterized protein n=1 Tax=Asprobacillus argus TaxID=3076534 RepID=A0ABU3LAT7_9FLAO|nr:hypothetical protein [Flavobacteriaceae bacterium S356]
MENPFKKILHQEEVPAVLKKKVINDVAMIKLTIDVADLFVIKYPNTVESLLTLNSKKNKKKPKDKD